MSTSTFRKMPASPMRRTPSKWSPSYEDVCGHAPMEVQTVITPQMINARCIGCGTCCKCNVSAEALNAWKHPLQNRQNAFTYHVKHSACMGCGLSSHKKIYDLSRVSIPLAVSFEFHNKCCEYLRTQPYLSNSEVIELVLTFFAPSTIPSHPTSAPLSAWKANDA
jgi:ferredoxin